VPRSEAEAALASPQAAAAALVLEGTSPATGAEGISATEAPERIGCCRPGREAGAVATWSAEAWAVWASRAVFRGVHPQFAAVDFVTVEAFDGLCRRFLARELDKRETTRPTRFPVRSHVDVGNFSGGGEGRGERLLSGAEIQVADEYLGRNGCTPLMWGFDFSRSPDQASLM